MLVFDLQLLADWRFWVFDLDLSRISVKMFIDQLFINIWLFRLFQSLLERVKNWLKIRAEMFGLKPEKLN